jgi:hypothetical protein
LSDNDSLVSVVSDVSLTALGKVPASQKS